MKIMTESTSGLHFVLSVLQNERYFFSVIQFLEVRYEKLFIKFSTTT